MSKLDGSGGSQTVDRALAVLQAVVSGNAFLPLDRIASTVGLHRSAVYRVLRSLESAGYVARDPVGGGYGIGSTLLAMGVEVASRLDVRGTVRPAMERMVQTFGETVSLHVRNGKRRICIEVVDGVHPIRRMVPVGEAHPVYAGETGRALLAGLSGAEAGAAITAAAAAGLDIDRLRSDIEQTRRDGWFIGIGTRTPDVGAISIPLHGPDGAPNALTVSGPANRWGRDAMRAAAPEIMRIIQPIARRLAGDRSVLA